MTEEESLSYQILVPWSEDTGPQLHVLLPPSTVPGGSWVAIENVKYLSPEGTTQD